MTHIAPFQYDDLKHLAVQDRHAETLAKVLEQDKALVGALTQNQWSSTAWQSPLGMPLACYGILPGGEGWAFLAKDLRRDMIAITRHARGDLDRYAREIGPTWIRVDPKFPEGQRWAKLLGYRPSVDDKWIIVR